MEEEVEVVEEEAEVEEVADREDPQLHNHSHQMP
jgi:hypothetical protein